MQLLKQITIIALFCCAISSCGREKEVVKQKSKYDLLTQNNWLLVEAYSNTEKNGEHKTEDLYNQLDSCEKDDLVIFSKDYKVTLDQGPVKCFASTPQKIVKEKWILVSNTQLEFIDIFSEAKYEANIILLSETILHLRLTGTETDGTKYERTFKYEKAP